MHFAPRHHLITSENAAPCLSGCVASRAEGAPPPADPPSGSSFDAGADSVGWLGLRVAAFGLCVIAQHVALWWMS